METWSIKYFTRSGQIEYKEEMTMLFDMMFDSDIKSIEKIEAENADKK